MTDISGVSSSRKGRFVSHILPRYRSRAEWVAGWVAHREGIIVKVVDECHLKFGTLEMISMRRR